VESLARAKRKGKGLVRRTILVLATMVVMLLVAGGLAIGQPNYCEYSSSTGWNCYCPGGGYCYGTNVPEGDYMWGTNSSETIYGLKGDDVLHGYGGNDTVVGGPGADEVDGGRGRDVCDIDADDYDYYGCERLR
jgi:hypothetical protein